MPALIAMNDAGLLTRVLGGVGYLAAFENMAKVGGGAGLPADPVRRLGALGVAVGGGRRAAVAKIAARQQRARAAGVDGRGLAADRAGGDEAAARALLYRLESERLHRPRRCWPGRARKASAHDEAWRALASLPQRWTPPVFPLQAADFIARGVEKGPALGAALRAAEEAWIAAGFPGEEAALEAIARGGAARK